MNENENMVSTELQKQVDEKIKELKAADPKLKKVYAVVVDGDEYDEKEVYIGYFKRPTFAAFSKFLTISQKADNAVAMRGLAKDCFVAGDKELVDDDDIFLFGTMAQLGNIIEVRHGQLVNLSKPGK
jgi:hypothetical protein